MSAPAAATASIRSPLPPAMSGTDRPCGGSGSNLNPASRPGPGSSVTVSPPNSRGSTSRARATSRIRAPARSNGSPTDRTSSSAYPAPIPSSSRPPLITSTVAASCASSPSGRNAMLMTCVPRRSRSVTAAAAAIAGSGAGIPVWSGNSSVAYPVSSARLATSRTSPSPRQTRPNRNSRIRAVSPRPPSASTVFALRVRWPRARGTHDPPAGRPAPRAVRRRPGPGRQPAGALRRRGGPPVRTGGARHRGVRQAPAAPLRGRPQPARPPGTLRPVPRRPGAGATAGRAGAATAGGLAALPGPARTGRVRAVRPGTGGGPAGPPRRRPAARRRRPVPAVPADLPQPDPAGQPAAGPVGGRRHRPHLRHRGAVPGRAAADPARSGAHRRRVGGAVARPQGAHEGRVRHRPDRHRTPGAHTRGDGPPAPGRPPRRGGVRLPPRRPAVPGVRDTGTPGPARRPPLVLVPALPAGSTVSGALLGSGREADVYAAGPGRVRRRYRDGRDVTDEAAVMAYLHGLGYPVPEVYEAAGADLVMERVDGPTLLRALAAGEVGPREAG